MSNVRCTQETRYKIMTNLLNFLTSIHPISPKTIEFLSGTLKVKTLPKNTIMLKEGQICDSIYFIESGLVRSYYFKDDTEISSWFMKEGDVIISVESFYSQSPSKEYIQTLENTTVFGISYQDLSFLYHNYPEFNFIGRVLTEKYYRKSEERLHNMRKQKGISRYEFFRDNEPDLVQRVQSRYIASYLGLNMETLSRLKRK